MTGKQSLLLIVFSVVLTYGMLVYVDTGSAAQLAFSSGHGMLFDGVDENGSPGRRQFSFSARTTSDGTVKGSAILHNPAGGAGAGQPYMLHIDISCMKVIGNIAFFGGTTQRTSDAHLVDAVYFSIQDNGAQGAGRDKLSRAFFFDDDPDTMGDPQLCQGNQVGDFPMEVIEIGDIGLQP